VNASSRPANGHSSSSQRALGALGDQLELVLAQPQRVRVGQLAAGMEPHAQALGVDRGLEAGAARLQLGQEDTWEHARLDVRGACDVAHALGVEPPRVGQRGVERPGAVVDAGEKMAMEVHVGHWGGSLSAGRRCPRSNVWSPSTLRRRDRTALRSG
jgi:hypothetical protein